MHEPESFRQALRWCLLAVTLVGCGTPRQSGPPVKMAPIEIVAKRTPTGEFEISHRDAASLFEKAVVAHQADRQEEAIDTYKLILKEFGDSKYLAPARYNLGMAYEEQGQHAAALEQYEALVASNPRSADARDARFRAVSCQRVLGRLQDAQRTLGEILSDPDVSVVDTYIARVRLGEVLTGLARLDEAEHEYRVILARSRPRPGREEALAPGYVLAETHFGLARVHRARFDNLPIRLPLEQMGKDIAAKVQLFKRAQSVYLRAVRLGVPATTTAAGLALGEMYEKFCRDLLEAPVPPDVSAEETAVYYEELFKEFRPLLERAIYIYKKTLKVAERLGASNVWVESARKRLEALRQLLEKERSLEELRRFLDAKPAPAAKPVSMTLPGSGM